jgi:peptidoglycan DL-endopeptidase CwlO
MTLSALSRDRLSGGRPRNRSRRPGVVPAFILCVVAIACLGLFVIWFSGADASAAPATSTTAGLPSTTTSSIYLYGTAKSQVDSLTGQAGQVQAQINTLDDELELATESYNQFQVKLDQLNIRMAGLRRDLQKAQNAHDARVKAFEDRIVGMYKNGGRDQLLQMLLLADGVDDLVARVRVVSELAGQDRRLVDNLKESTDDLNAILKEIDEHKKEELAIRQQMDDQRDTIEAKLAERKNTLAGIGTQITQAIEAERVRQAQEQEKLRQRLLGLLNGGQVYSGPLPQNSNAVLNQLVQTAATYMGIPYVWAGDRPSTGFDCSGFTQFVFAQHGVSLPHYSGYQAQMGVPVDLKDIQAGDLVAFGFPVHHVGIYIGDGLFINAPRTGDVVKIEPLSGRNNLSAIRRFTLQERVGAPAVR